MAKIVVGIDGSPASEAALRWALEEAELRRLPITAIYAYEYPIVSTTSQALHLLEKGFAEYRAAAERVLDEVLNEVAANASVQPESVVMEGPPAAALIEAAGEDDLLVVGSRGHGGFAGLMLGSVSEQCARHARSPVVIVRPKSQAG
jgi:nucleotide-binding universal stress UspA family protein